MTQPHQPPLSLDQADANLRQAREDLRRRVAEVRAQRGETPEEDGESQDEDPVDPEAWSQILASYDGEAVTWQDHATRIIANSGPDGVGPGEIPRALAVHGVVVHRDTLAGWLRAELDAARIRKPRHGRWAAP